MTRRELLLAASAAAACSTPAPETPPPTADVPAYLAAHADAYARDPHAAALEWFRDAKFGLFLHYGLYSQQGGAWDGQQVFNRNNRERPVAEWLQFHAVISVAEYAALADTFTAEGFDADFITDLALAAEMKYVNITTRHHDSFCLFRTAETEFQSLNTPAKRDLVGELAEACAKKGLGLFLYYSHGRDWRHPHAPPSVWAANARPHYDQPQPEYVPEDEVDVALYADFMEKQVTELLSQYGPIAGIWLDGEGVLKSYGGKIEGGLERACEMIRLPQLYAKVRELQPQCLVSYKRGVLGDEDFITPERTSFGLEELGKPMEINTTLQAHSWGYNQFTKRRKDVDEIWETLTTARSLPASLLLNTGPRGDGSIVVEEEATLRGLGERIRTQGWPEPA